MTPMVLKVGLLVESDEAQAHDPIVLKVVCEYR